MVQQGAKPLEPFIEDVLGRMSDMLTQGLSQDQAQWALNAYRTTVLPYVLRFAATEGEEERQQRAAIVVKNQSADLVELTPAEKWATVMREYYSVRLSPMSDAAFEHAEDLYKAGQPQEELRQAAESTLSRLEELIKELEEHAPKTLEELAETFSEAIVDCEYVIRGGGDIVSLRLNRLIEHELAMGKQGSLECPSCGTTNPPESRFCNQCGNQFK